MGKNRRRKRDEDRHYHQQPIKKHHETKPTNPNKSSIQNPKKPPSFPSYLETQNLSPKVKLLCEIIAQTPSSTVESVLDNTGIHLTSNDVEQVLKLSYSFPGSAVKFFRWAGFKLQDNHSPYSWNLVVDLLGKNRLFEAMWDAIKSMKTKNLISLATFASVFSSYVIADQVKQAILTFEVMNKYDWEQNVVALNSLLSAICRDGKIVDAVNFLAVVKGSIRPDGDTYAILLEGWEKERNVDGCKQSFDDMIMDMGWDPNNVPAYDAYLCTLLMSRNGLDVAVKFLDVMKERGCCPGIRFFRMAIEECLKVSDVKMGMLIWDVMVGRNVCRPDINMYNSMISLFCHTINFDLALNFLDEMVYNGVFPNRSMYNLLLQSLIKSRKVKEISLLFNEMMKNECIPSHANCSAAIRVFLHHEDPYTAIKIWKCMVENYESDLEETANWLIVQLCKLSMHPEALRYADSMFEKGIKITSSTLTTFKQCLKEVGKQFAYESLLRKWKAR